MFILIFFIPSNHADALTVMPALKKLYVKPGNQLVETITLFNEGTHNLTVRPVIENFRPKGTNGVPEFLGDHDTEGAARWIHIPFQQIILKPHEQQSVVFKIDIPQWSVPGGHYAALLWSVGNVKDNNVTTISRVGTLFLFAVEGKITGDIKLRTFRVVRDSVGEVTGFFIDLINTSNVHVVPQGTVDIHTRVGKRMDNLNINVAQRTVLAQSERAIFISWKSNTSMLPLKAHIHIDFDFGFPPINQDIFFYNLPPNAGLKMIVVFVFVCLCGIVWWKKRKIKKEHALITSL